MLKMKKLWLIILWLISLLWIYLDLADVVFQLAKKSNIIDHANMLSIAIALGLIFLNLICYASLILLPFYIISLFKNNPSQCCEPTIKLKILPKDKVSENKE
jgi:hypothetical protein